MIEDFEATLSDVAKYYSGKLVEHGNTSKGVDWNSVESQFERFHQLCKVIDAGEGFSINDLGCGYGALLDYLYEIYPKFTYHGYDISTPMISAARCRYPGEIFSESAQPIREADFSVASGIFNVKLDCPEKEWIKYIENTLHALDETSRKGFSFNILTSYSDTEKMQDYLFYADPCKFFDFCKKNFSRNVALLHDYGIYEFTILVKK